MNGKSDRDTKSANRSEGIKRRTLLLSTTSLVALSGVTATALPAQGQPPQEILPKPEPPFRGKMGRTLKDSTPDFPKGVEAPAGAPNVLLILTDDVGFGATSTFWRADQDTHLSAARR
jgi:arylsulfatase